MPHHSPLLRACLGVPQLTKLGSRDQRRMFAQRLEDIQPSLRYCKYNVERSGGATSSTELRAMLNAAEVRGGARASSCPSACAHHRMLYMCVVA